MGRAKLVRLTGPGQMGHEAKWVVRNGPKVQQFCGDPRPALSAGPRAPRPRRHRATALSAGPRAPRTALVRAPHFYAPWCFNATSSWKCMASKSAGTSVPSLWPAHLAAQAAFVPQLTHTHTHANQLPTQPIPGSSLWPAQAMAVCKVPRPVPCSGAVVPCLGCHPPVCRFNRSSLGLLALMPSPGAVLWLHGMSLCLNSTCVRIGVH